jgi:RimJ/RimL family protein N-acetyltransferase
MNSPPPLPHAPPPLAGWLPRPLPQRVMLHGQYCRLEPLDALRHGDDLFIASMSEWAEVRHRYLFDSTMDRASFQGWMEAKEASEDPLFFAVIDARTGRAEGRQALMRMDPNHGVIEIGNILWGTAISRQRAATEALFLMAYYAFETLRYRRFEWKCDNRNMPSKRAAERFGFTFEGIFRQHMVVKGESRDTAWFAMLDRDWPRLRAGYETWLIPSNFDENGLQKQKLSTFLAGK